MKNGSICVEYCDDEKVQKIKKVWGIGNGEASIIALALEQKHTVSTDDYAAMSVARSLNLKYITTPVFIHEMGRRGILTKKNVSHKLLTLLQYAWISEETINTVLSWQNRKDELWS